MLAVGADRDGTGGVERAERAGIPTFVARVPDYVTRADWDLDLERLVAEHGPDLVVSAGFMKVLGPAVLAAHRVVNTHPALLPSFPGAHGVRDAMAHGVKVTGCTCHWVDAGVDTGPIIDQRAVRVEPDDTVETLHERIKVARARDARRRACVASRRTAPGRRPKARAAPVSRAERSRAAIASGRASLTQPPTPLSEPARYFRVPGARSTDTTCRCRRDTSRPVRTGAWCQAAM